MTFRSSAVIPPVRMPPAVKAIVMVCSPFNARSITHAPDLAGFGPWDSLYGNIAVKPPPIRLSAFVPMPPGHSLR